MSVLYTRVCGALSCRTIVRRKSMAAGQHSLEQETLKHMRNIILHRGKKPEVGSDPARDKQ